MGAVPAPFARRIAVHAFLEDTFVLFFEQIESPIVEGHDFEFVESEPDRDENILVAPAETLAYRRRVRFQLRVVVLPDPAALPVENNLTVVMPLVEIRGPH